MSNEQSIREAAADWIAGLISGNGFGDDYVDDEIRQWAEDLLASPVIRRIQAEAAAKAIQAHRDLHQVYASTSACRGGIGGMALTEHCAVVCDNPNHDAAKEAWHQVEMDYFTSRGETA